jgi:histidine triad (HIT) family protein
MSGCVFCDIIKGKAPATVVAETPSSITIVPLNPVTEGHLLVIPKIHAAYIWELPGWRLLYDIGEQAKQAYPCNIIQSNGTEATQTVFHVHFHIVPRRKGDGLNLPWANPGTGFEGWSDIVDDGWTRR